MKPEWPITRYAVRYRRKGEGSDKPWLVLGNYDRPGEAYELKTTLDGEGAQSAHVVSFQISEYTPYEI